MNYVILRYFIMVHICNIKTLANTIRHKSSTNYDVDGFINQLLASQKFDELADKVADKAAYKIKNIEAPQARLERFSDANKLNKSVEIQQNFREQSNREYDKEYENNFSNKPRNEQQTKDGKIDTQALMMDKTTSQSDNLKLKYKYLTRNAYEKKVFSDRTEIDDRQIVRNDKTQDMSKQSEKRASGEEFQEHEKVDAHQITPEKSQHSSKKEYENDDNRWRHEMRENNREQDSNRNKKIENPFNDNMKSAYIKNIKKVDHSREQVPRREADNARPEFKSAVKNQVQANRVDNSTSEEEKTSTGEEESKNSGTPSAEKTPEEDNDQEEEKSVEEKEDDLVPMQFRAKEESGPDIEENKVHSGENSHSEHDYNHSAEPRPHSTETHDGRSPEYHGQENSSQDNRDHTEEINDRSNEGPRETTSRKTIIRQEGNKLYAFVEKPEYAEYHEEVAKVQKEDPNAAVAFL